MEELNKKKPDGRKNNGAVKAYQEAKVENQKQPKRN